MKTNNRLTNGGKKGIASNSQEELIREDKMGGKYYDPNLFSADRIIDKMAPNLAKAEAQTKERPLKTENTSKNQ